MRERERERERELERERERFFRSVKNLVAMLFHVFVQRVVVSVLLLTQCCLVAFVQELSGSCYVEAYGTSRAVHAVDSLRHNEQSTLDALRLIADEDAWRNRSKASDKESASSSSQGENQAAGNRCVNKEKKRESEERDANQKEKDANASEKKDETNRNRAQSTSTSASEAAGDTSRSASSTTRSSRTTKSAEKRRLGPIVIIPGFGSSRLRATESFDCELPGAGIGLNSGGKYDPGDDVWLDIAVRDGS